MYLARKTIGKRIRYFIRDTYLDGDTLKSRDVFDLGGDPGRHIVYPGGNGYYYDDEVVAAIERLDLDPASEDLDRVFWDFLDPQIRRAIEGFQRPGKAVAMEAAPDLLPGIHPFDKRRLNFLKFGRVDPGDIARLSPKLTRALHHKSRDEMEQYFCRSGKNSQTHGVENLCFCDFRPSASFFGKLCPAISPGAQRRKDGCMLCPRRLSAERKRGVLEGDGPGWRAGGIPEKIRDRAF